MSMTKAIVRQQVHVLLNNALKRCEVFDKALERYNAEFTLIARSVKLVVEKILVMTFLGRDRSLLILPISTLHQHGIVGPPNQCNQTSGYTLLGHDRSASIKHSCVRTSR